MSISARIEHLRAEDLIDEPVPTARPPRQAVGRRRQLAAVALAAAGLPLLTLLLRAIGDGLSLEGQVLLYLLLVVLVALLGGVVIAVVSAVAAAGLINWFFVAPTHTLTIAHADQAVGLVVFVAVAAVVAVAVEIATRRGRAAAEATQEAEVLSRLTGGDLREDETLRGVLARAQETFGLESVTLLSRDRGTDGWTAVERAGWGPPGDEAPLRFDVPVTRDLRLVGRGPAMFAQDQRVLTALAGAARTAWEGRRLTAKAEEARVLADVDRQRAALLTAVGHDLRTPLAGIKASVSSLRQDDVEWSPEERAELLAAIEASADRLDAVVRNLLDASRLQAGALTVRLEPVALDEVVSAAIVAVPGSARAVRLDVPEDLPLVRADRGLLERVLANVLDNALRHGASDRAVEIRAFAGGEAVKVEVADHGPGVSRDERERLFEPFRRLDDTSTEGVGLGLSVARGFIEAMGGATVADATPGGGLTVRLRLPRA